MLDSRNLLSGTGKYILGGVSLLFATAICIAFGMTGIGDFDSARREVMLRSVGHELLLQSGDSTSRVLPVKKIAENEYQISFEHALTFQTAALVDITGRVLANDPLAADYVVNVVNKGSVMYGYAISKNIKNDIVPCLGRKQPVAPYLVNIKFKPAGIITAKNELLLGSLPLLAFVGFIVFRSVKPRKALPGDRFTDVLTLGTVLFDATNRKLVINGKTTDLTGTETRVLRIFALSPNETISRNRLQKEIWEDEGVIVGRSLDMFISKLRKKLETELRVGIVVVRGKGYRLEVDA